MKNEFKFMLGNEFARKTVYLASIKKNDVIITNFQGGDAYCRFINDEVFEEPRQLTKSDFKLTGITADCLNALTLNCVGKIEYYEEEIIIDDDTSTERNSGEPLKQFYLRVAKEMGWLDE